MDSLALLEADAPAGSRSEGEEDASGRSRNDVQIEKRAYQLSAHEGRHECDEDRNANAEAQSQRAANDGEAEESSQIAQDGAGAEHIVQEPDSGSAASVESGFVGREELTREREVRLLVEQLLSWGVQADEARSIAEEQLQLQEDEAMAMRLIHVDAETDLSQAAHPQFAGSRGKSPQDCDADTEAVCIICLEPEQTCPKLSSCDHSSLCLVCMSKLSKLECPTCRVPLSEVELAGLGRIPVKQIVAERKRSENESWKETVQIAFVGPRSALPRQSRDEILMFARRHAHAPGHTDNGSHADKGQCSVDEEPALQYLARADESLEADERGAFCPQLRVGSSGVHMSVLQRHSLAAKRMVLDDLRILRPDVTVICGYIDDSGDSGVVSLETVLRWDRLIRTGSSLPRIWLLHFGRKNLLGEDEVMCTDSGKRVGSSSVENQCEKEERRIRRRPLKRSAILSAVESFQPNERPNAVFFACDHVATERSRAIFTSAALSPQTCPEASKEDSKQSHGLAWQWCILKYALERAKLSRATRSSFLPIGVVLPSTFSPMPGAPSTGLEATSVVNNGIGSVINSLSNFMSWSSPDAAEGPASSENETTRRHEDTREQSGLARPPGQELEERGAQSGTASVDSSQCETSAARASPFQGELDGMDIVANAFNNAMTSVVSWWNS